MRRRTQRPREGEEEGAQIDVGLGLGGIFKGLGSFIELLGKMAEEGESEWSRTGTTKGPGRSSVMYGFTVKVGAGGVPRVERFGNVRATEHGAVVEEVREPPVDVFDEGAVVVVIAELPGVDGDAITLEVKDDILLVSASDSGREYRKEVLLPCAVLAETMESSYRNGILEIRLAKAAGAQS